MKTNISLIIIISILIFIGVVLGIVFGYKQKDSYGSSCLGSGEDPFQNCGKKCCNTCFDRSKGAFYCSKDSCPSDKKFTKPACCPNNCPDGCSYLCDDSPSCMGSGENPFQNCGKECCNTCFDLSKGTFYCSKDSCPSDKKFIKPACCPNNCPDGCSYLCGESPSCMGSGENPFQNCGKECCNTCFDRSKGTFYCSKDSCPSDKKFIKPACCPNNCPDGCSYLCGESPTPPLPPSGNCHNDGVCYVGNINDNTITLKYDDFSLENHGKDPSSCADYTNDNLSRRDDGGISLGYNGVKTPRVISKHSFVDGLFIFTASFPNSKAVFPAIWLYGKDGENGEIDILETKSDDYKGSFNIVRNVPWATTMLDDNGNYKQYGVITIGDKTQFHQYVLYRKKNIVISYVDPIFKDGKIYPKSKDHFVVYDLYNTDNNSDDSSAMNFLVGRKMKIVLNIAINDHDNPGCTFDEYKNKHCESCPKYDRGSMEVLPIQIKEF
jgi:hypothetical protein